jgi:hypothetical protein
MTWEECGACARERLNGETGKVAKAESARKEKGADEKWRADKEANAKKGGKKG